MACGCRRRKAHIIIPTVVLAEVLFLAEKGRLSVSFDTVLTTVKASSFYHIHLFETGVLKDGCRDQRCARVVRPGDCGYSSAQRSNCTDQRPGHYCFDGDHRRLVNQEGT